MLCGRHEQPYRETIGFWRGFGENTGLFMNSNSKSNVVKATFATCRDSVAGAKITKHTLNLGLELGKTFCIGSVEKLKKMTNL